MENEKEAISAYNTAIAAAATEKVIPKATIGQYWNRLLVLNRGAVPIRVQLDNRTDLGYIFELRAGDGLSITELDGIQFSEVYQKNVDAANAEVADLILFRASRV